MAHAERREELAPGQGLEIGARPACDRVGQQHRGKVGVFELRAWRGGQLHISERRQQRGLVEVGVGIVHAGRTQPRRQRRQSRRMRDHVAQQDRLALVVGHPGARRQPRGQGVVERAFALRDQVGQQGGGHGLADRADLEGRVRADAAAVGLVGALVAADDLIALDHRHGHAGAGAVAMQALADHLGQLRIGQRLGRSGQAGAAGGQRQCNGQFRRSKASTCDVHATTPVSGCHHVPAGARGRPGFATNAPAPATNRASAPMVRFSRPAAAPPPAGSVP